MGLGGEPVWPQDPSLHQGLCFWLKQNNLLSLQVFSHLGSVPG